MKLVCIASIIVNLTPNWTRFDQETLNKAKHRCGEWYANSPCLKKFTKLKPLHYRAICGRK